MRNRPAIIVAVVLLLGLLFSAVGYAQTTITWAIPDALEDQEVSLKLAERYMELNPNVKVELLPIDDGDYNAKLYVLFASGAAPDVFVAPEVAIPFMSRQGMVQDLNVLIERDNYDTSDFFPLVLENLTVDGGLYGLTAIWDAQVMYVNKTTFNERAVAKPE